MPVGDSMRRTFAYLLICLPLCLLLVPNSTPVALSIPISPNEPYCDNGAPLPNEDTVVRLARENPVELLELCLMRYHREIKGYCGLMKKQERIKDKDVPDFVKNFLRGPWAQVLAQAQLRSAAGASDPAGYANAADDLIWSVQLRLTRRNRARLVGLVPNLLVKLRQGLHEISYPDERIPVLFDALIGLHEQAFEVTAGGAKLALVQNTASHFGPDDRLEADELDSVWNPQPASKAADMALNSRDALEDSGFDSQVNSVLAADAEPSPWSVADLKIGSWVELFLQGIWVRAQLTWASPHATLFMFVSGVGLAHSMSRRTMDQRRAQGLIRVVSGGDVVGHALDAVAQAALRNQPPPVTGPAPLE